MSLFTETVKLRMRGGATGGYDEDGNPVYAPARDVPWPAWYEIRGSTEHEDAREQQIYGFWLYLPLEAPLAGADAVVIDGIEYRVVGEPGRQPGGFIVDGYVRAAVGKVTG